jgi:phage terminase large subunit-like protein
LRGRRRSAPWFEAGNIYLPHPEYGPWVEDFIEECVQFPNGAHDDQGDAMTQALLRRHEVPKQQTHVTYCDIVQISPV